MFKNLAKFYGICVMLISSVVIMISFAVLLLEIIAFSLPEYKYADQLNHYSSDARYLEYTKKEKINLADKKNIESLRLSEKENQIFLYKTGAVMGMLSCLSWLFVGFIFLAIHIYIYRKLPSDGD
ncbi:MAG: hypothetical protein V4485_00255 [Pseudomonadota bacterium]